MNVAAFLERTASFLGDRPALALGAEVVASYREMRARAQQVAGVLAALGLGPGDRCGIAMSNTPRIMEVMFGCWYANIAAVPMNAKLHRREFAYILENSGARACFVNGKLAETLEGLEGQLPALSHLVDTDSHDYERLISRATALPMQDASPEDPAWLFYTSGTTGRPKGATLSHRNLVAMTMNYFCDVDAIATEDCIIHSAPMTHGSGLYGLPHVARGALQVVPESGGFEVDETLALIEHHHGTTFFFAPTMIVRLLEHPDLQTRDLSALKTVVYGGGPMYVNDTLRALEILGPKLVQIYGQGEAPMTITGLTRAMHAETDHPRYLERLGSVGPARTDVEVRVVDENDRPLPAGEIGEIALRGDVVMRGYWRNPEANARTLAGGWLHTGDLGVLDEEGFVTLKDRSKDMIISGGTNIYPREVEEVLLTHPQVLEVSVVGTPHPEWGEDVLAFIVTQDGASIEVSELDRLCLANIARFKRPKHYRFIDSLPKNNYGKVLKTALRARIAEEDESPPGPGNRDGIASEQPA